MRMCFAVLAWVVSSGCATVPIPGPTGEFGVGTTRYEVSERGFDDPYSPQPAPRRVPVQVWYPASPGGGVREPYVDDDVAQAMSELGLPRSLLPNDVSRSEVNAPPVAGRYPVLIFNHGFTSFQTQSASLMEELASHGYLVLSVGHPYESLVVRYADGTVIKQRRDLPAIKTIVAGLKDLEHQVAQVEPLLVRARAARDAPALREAMNALAQSPSYAVLLPVLELWTHDTRLVIDALGQLDDGTLAPRLKGLVDAEHLGVFGHSLGGMLAGHLAMTDPRVKAGLNFDGAQLPPPGDAPYQLGAPFCFLYADTTKVGDTLTTDEGMNDALVVDGPPGSCGASLRGAAHANFSDMNHWPVMARALGSIDRAEMTRVLREMTLGFFDHHLKGQPLSGFTPSATLRVRWSSMHPR